MRHKHDPGLSKWAWTGGGPGPTCVGGKWSPPRGVSLLDHVRPRVQLDRRLDSPGRSPIDGSNRLDAQFDRHLDSLTVAQDGEGDRLPNGTVL